MKMKYHKLLNNFNEKNREAKTSNMRLSPKNNNSLMKSRGKINLKINQTHLLRMNCSKAIMHQQLISKETIVICQKKDSKEKEEVMN